MRTLKSINLNHFDILKILRGSQKEESEENEERQATGLLMMFSWSRSVLLP